MTDSLLAIDVHGHYGAYRRGANALMDRLMSGDAATVLARAARARTRLTFVSPIHGLLPRGGAEVLAANEEAARVVAAHPGLRQWVIINPLEPRSFAQATRMLNAPWCVGIKLHPEEHLYPIREQARAIFEFAAARRAVVISHSGEANSLPEDFVPWANEFPEVTLILSHLGCNCDGDPSHQVRAVAAARHGNVCTDTSSATGITSGLLEGAVAEVGAEHILYGTDTPLYFAPMQRARVDCAELPDADKRLILYDNACRLFRLAEGETHEQTHR